MLVRRFDPDRREMMGLLLKVLQGTVPSAKEPSAEARFYSVKGHYRVSFPSFIQVELKWENKTSRVLKLDHNYKNE